MSEGRGISNQICPAPAAAPGLRFLSLPLVALPTCPQKKNTYFTHCDHFTPLLCPLQESLLSVSPNGNPSAVCPHPTPSPALTLGSLCCQHPASFLPHSPWYERPRSLLSVNPAPRPLGLLSQGSSCRELWLQVQILGTLAPRGMTSVTHSRFRAHTQRPE